ncbi:MAG: hypothetical protein WDW20_03740, partial [Neisseriaceae bacterium]
MAFVVGLRQSSWWLVSCLFVSVFHVAFAKQEPSSLSFTQAVELLQAHSPALADSQAEVQSQVY